MNKANQEKIFSSCPILFRHRFNGNTENLRWLGIHCGHGWFKFILELSKQVEEVLKEYRIIGEELPWVIKIEAKYGGLNYVVSTQSDEIVRVIHLPSKPTKAKRKSGTRFGKTRRMPGRRQVHCEMSYQKLRNFT